MNVEKQLEQAAARARRSSADSTIPDLGQRRQRIRLRRGLGTAAIAAVAVLLVLLPLAPKDNPPGISPADSVHVPDSSVAQTPDPGKLGGCEDPSIVSRMDTMLAVVNLTASWERGRAGSFLGLLPVPAVDADCSDYYRGDLGGGRFVGAVVSQADGEISVTMIPSPPQGGWDVEFGGASMSIDDEVVYGLVSDGVFVGINGRQDLVLVSPYLPAQP